VTEIVGVVVRECCERSEMTSMLFRNPRPHEKGVGQPRRRHARTAGTVRHLRLPFGEPQVHRREGRQRDRAVHFTEYLVNAPPACVSEFGPSAA
jgi:hypothetical protein